MSKYNSNSEEELKSTIRDEFFPKTKFEYKIFGKIDFAIVQKENNRMCLWAEAKKYKADYVESLIQLILTIGKSRAFDHEMPPAYLGAFDNEKIAFLPYHLIQPIFYLNDFNWNVTPSNHETKEFKQLANAAKEAFEKTATVFFYEKDKIQLKEFIATQFISREMSENAKLQIDKNNFISVYAKWRDEVKESITIDWTKVRKAGIIDADFYLADLLSENNLSLKEKLFVLLKSDHYEFDIDTDVFGMISLKQAVFNDKQKAHAAFWKKYQRPPKEEYWDYIIERRDLLVPQDVRERKGSFFTPKIWVELSQKYLADALGENWQDEYTVWDCCAGTGNLLAGLTNKYNIWASTLDRQDVDVMKDRIRNGANMLDSHVFQFDFLNDDFSKLPQPLQDIINDEEKRKKLVIYINPPYAEVSSLGKKEKTGVNISNTHKKYNAILGTAGREVYTQFLIRIFFEIKGCVIAEFSKLKLLQGSAFALLRKSFRPTLLKLFIVPANTFDNVKGQFPIGFFIWNTNELNDFTSIESDVYKSDASFETKKIIETYTKEEYIGRWISSFKYDYSIQIGFLAGTNGNDFQQNNIVYILNKKEQMANPRGKWINHKNLLITSIYFAVRHVIEATWLNDRDQFLYPNDGWETDTEFQNDCLAYTLFNNNIQSKYGINHWIPFTEAEVDAKEKFDSHFMTDYIAGKISSTSATNSGMNLFSSGLETREHATLSGVPEGQCNLPNPSEGGAKKCFSPSFGGVSEGQGGFFRGLRVEPAMTELTLTREHAPLSGVDNKDNKIIFSAEAQAVMDAGRELWKYYHSQPGVNVNASLYDIREYFQGRNDKGRMNTRSENETYTKLIADLRDKLDLLARRIEPKVYEYGFLKK